MTITEEQFRFMVEDISADLIERLVSREHRSLKEAVDILYSSDTYKALTRPETGLYVQSSGYIFEYLTSELKTGKLS
ncbi:MAG: hypothetical protein MJZ90_04000 [Bacteroidales bacterium]|nr:hypothetical protein [Candidatus Limimorpha caballi]MCQ2318068.1 hypothetical protein [Bacteroidales bacterium]